MVRDRAPFRFRPVLRTDLSLLHRWYNAAHVRRWFDGGATPEKIEGEYLPYITGTVPIRAFVAVHEGCDIGLIQWERLGDFPDVQRIYRVEDPETANCDLLIGEPEFASRGLGPALVREFLAQVVFRDPR